MALECNIDAQGKAFRLAIGIASVIGGIALSMLLATNLIPYPILWLGVAGSIVGGAFSIWEARAGWCVVRALGFKTAF